MVTKTNIEDGAYTLVAPVIFRGNSHVFCIPAKDVQNKVVIKGKLYRITAVPVQKTKEVK